MACKLDHTDPESLPAFLCRACNPLPPLAARSTERVAIEAALKPEDATRYARKRKRRLRAEVKALADELEKFKLARVGKDMIEAAESKWQNAYAELALMLIDD
jgi:hypothetical protein